MSGNEINIKLLCPSLSKVIQVVACDDEKIDLGSISRAFGLDPSTVRLNGHFISRGVDLVASSVTWKSLLSFFSSKGLSTGKDQRHALLVTGKVRHKRGHDSQDFQNEIGKVMEGENAGNSKGIQLEAVNLIKNKKLKESNSVMRDSQWPKLAARESNFWKMSTYSKQKINEDKSDIRDKVDDLSGSIALSQFSCSYASKNLKRIREDEAIVAANCKRIR